MSLPAVARRWQSPSAEICRRCANQLLLTRQQQQTITRQQVPLTQQRRHMTGKAFRKHGPKYTAKIDAADEEWAEKKAKTEAGELKAMWDVFEERGYIKDVAGTRQDIRRLLIDKRIGAYVGIDPTAASLHVGHLLPLMPLFWMYMNGYRAVTLIGGATAKIGDPTDRLKSRDDVKNAVIAMNMLKIHYQLKKIWTNVEIQARRYGYTKTWAWRRGVLQNGHWWNKLPMLEVLQRLGAGIRIGPMLSRDTVKRKLTQGDGMSFAEFTYPLMQAWDWWHMYVAQGIQMQIGGSDQYGNIITGVDAFKTIRASEPDPQKKLPSGMMVDPVGFTVPLLTDSAGNKFGKSAGNAVWLDKFQTSTFELYGYFVRRPDADIESLLRLFTFMPMEVISGLMKEHDLDPSKRVPHHALAYEVVALVHGETEANEARDRHQATYAKKTGNDSALELAAGEVDPDAEDKTPTTLNNAPQIDLKLPRSLFDEGKVARILFAAGLVKSVSEGNRIAIQKGAYVGAAPGQKAHVNKGMPLTQVDFTPVHLWFPADTKNFIIDDKYMVLRRGQHNVRVIEIISDEEYAESGLTYPGQMYTGKVRKLRDQLKTLREDVKADEKARKPRLPLSDADKNALRAAFEADGADEAAGAAASEAVAADDSANDGRLVFPDEKPEQIRRLEEDIKQEQKRRIESFRLRDDK